MPILLPRFFFFFLSSHGLDTLSVIASTIMSVCDAEGIMALRYHSNGWGSFFSKRNELFYPINNISSHLTLQCALLTRSIVTTMPVEGEVIARGESVVAVDWTSHSVSLCLTCTVSDVIIVNFSFRYTVLHCSIRHKYILKTNRYNGERKKDTSKRKRKKKGKDSVGNRRYVCIDVGVCVCVMCIFRFPFDEMYRSPVFIFLLCYHSTRVNGPFPHRSYRGCGWPQVFLTIRLQDTYPLVLGPFLNVNHTLHKAHATCSSSLI